MAKSHLEIAKQLKHNSLEIREYFEDLYKWQSELENEDNKKKKKKKKKKKREEEKKKESNKESIKKIVETTETCNKNNNRVYRNLCVENKTNSSLKRDGNSLDTFYRAWDKLNVDDVNETDERIDENERIEKNKKKEENEKHVEEKSKSVVYEDITTLKEVGPVKDEKGLNDVDYEITVSEEVEKVHNKSVLCSYPKVYEIYVSKNEENKIYFQKKEYKKCLECCNDVLNYIDYELSNNNIFLEIEKNWENEVYLDIISSNFSFDKKTEELFILRTKCLINRSLIYQKLCSFFESIQDSSIVILFYQYFLPNKRNCESYSISNLFTVNIKYTIFKSLYLRGTARYKLKIYKLSLDDFKSSTKFLVEEKKDSTNLSNVKKSIQIIENILNEIKVKKHLRRQNEYTATLMEQFKLKPRPLEIEVIPKRPTKQLPAPTTEETVVKNENEKDEVTKKKTQEKGEGRSEGESEGKSEKISEGESEKISEGESEKISEGESEKKYEKKSEKKNEEKKKDKTKKEKYASVENCINCNEAQEEIEPNFNNRFDSDSSLTISGESILTDIEETKPILLINSKRKEKAQIKNKINFEMLWNSSKVKKYYKEQIALLKMAFIDEGIFQFSSDKDMYVDILDALFKNKFLNTFEKDSFEEIAKTVFGKIQKDKLKNELQTTIKKKDENEDKNKDKNKDKNENKNKDKNEDINEDKKEKQAVEEKEKEQNLDTLVADDCVIIVDILYCMTNFGKDNFVFLFIDNNEKIMLQNFFNFILNYSQCFVCNENYIKHKTSLMKRLLSIEK